MKLRLAMLLALLGNYISSFSQEKPLFGNGMITHTAADSSWSVKFSPLLQFRATSDWEYSDAQFGEATQNFLIRRARFKVSGFVLSPKLKYKLQFGFSNSDMSGSSKFTGNTPKIILDAVLIWNFYQNFELWVGQTKLPGNLESMMSSGELQLIDRSLLSQDFGSDRDFGIQLHAFQNLSKKVLLREKFSISQGEGRNVSTGNLGGHQYSGRLELLPFGEFTAGTEYSQSDLVRETLPKLMMGISYNFNDHAVRTNGNEGNYMINSEGFYETDITQFFADATFKYRGFSFMGEFANRNAKSPIAINPDGSPATGEDGEPTNHFVAVGNAVNFQAGYVFKNNYEIAGRITHLNLTEPEGRKRLNQYTLGGSKYLAQHNLKIQTDFSYASENGNPLRLAFRLGCYLQF